MVGVPHAVVIRGEVNGLGVVRSLALGGVPTIVVDTTKRRPAAWSRFCTCRIVKQLSGRPFVDDLLALQRQLGGRPVLILTDEMAVSTVSEYREELDSFYRFHLPSPAMVTTLANKSLFHTFAEQHDLPLPRTIALRQDADFARLSGLHYPVIVKPADKHTVNTGRTQRLGYIRTADEAAVVCKRMLNTAGELVVQEWIDGPDGNIYFSLFHRGKELASTHIFFGRKIASHPPQLGSTAVCVAAPEAADSLEPLTRKFLDVADYQGLGSLEFKWDAQTQRFVIIEPTVGRTDWQEEIATLCGVNLPLIAYRYELGQPSLPRSPIDRSVAWRASLRHWQHRPELPADGRIYDGYWRSDDPMPAAVFYAGSVLRGAFRRLRRPAFERRQSALQKSTETA
jgi:D-aspartate ligase